MFLKHSMQIVIQSQHKTKELQFYFSASPYIVLNNCSFQKRIMRWESGEKKNCTIWKRKSFISSELPFRLCCCVYEENNRLQNGISVDSKPKWNCANTYLSYLSFFFYYFILSPIKRHHLANLGACFYFYCRNFLFLNLFCFRWKED